MSALAYISENLRQVREVISSAERTACREGQTLMLAAVKYGTDEELAALLQAGVTHVGENRVQQLLDHWPLFEANGTEVHFIGSLQTNKVKYIVDKVAETKIECCRIKVMAENNLVASNVIDDSETISLNDSIVT